MLNNLLLILEYLSHLLSDFQTVFLSVIAAMHIAGENENVPSWVADWPHCCDF